LRRVSHCDKRQAVRRREAGGQLCGLNQAILQICYCEPSLAHLNLEKDQAADHVVQEGIGTDIENQVIAIFLPSG
jgi:intracellular sulfur oxidation DsrE/DsrF family protein